MDTHLAVLRAQVAALRAELARTQLELGLWKSQLEFAQKEILRAQQVVDEVDCARADAEERAHRYRQTLRRLLEERAVQLARDEGRRLGYREGLQFGTTSRPSRPPTSRAPPLSKPPTVGPPAPPERQPRSHINNPTHDVPPDNYIPTLPEGDPAGGLALPPPHEWNTLPPSRTDQSFAHSSRAGPPSSGMSRRSRMTLPERIADEWRSQNPDVQNQDDAPIARPTSSSSGPPPPNNLNPATPPRRPTTTAPTPTSSDVFRGGNHNPSGDWLKPRSRSVSYTSPPNIAIQSPSMSPMSPFNITDRTAVDSGLLSPTQSYLQPTHKRPPVIPTPPPSTSTPQPQYPDIPQIYLPGITPLSPIPALSNLAAIPENTPTGSSRSHHLSINTSKSAAALSPSILTSKKPYYSTSSDSSTTSYPKSRPSSVPVPGASSSSVHSRDW